MVMLGLISLVATAEAHVPAIPNGTLTSRIDLEPAMAGLSGLAYTAHGWGEATRATWALLILMIPVVAKLLTRVRADPASGPSHRAPRDA